MNVHRIARGGPRPKTGGERLLLCISEEYKRRIDGKPVANREICTDNVFYSCSKILICVQQRGCFLALFWAYLR